MHEPKTSERNACPSWAGGRLFRTCKPSCSPYHVNQINPYHLRSRSSAQRHHKSSVALHNNERKCPSCSANHTLAQCRGFKKFATDRCIERVNELRVCFNCLLSVHTAKTCTRCACHTCRAKHHTLLHPASGLGSETDLTLEESEDDPNVQHDTSQSLSCTAPHATPSMCSYPPP